MPTYFLTSELSDVASTNYMAGGFSAQAGTTIAISVISGTNQTLDFITPKFYPNTTGQTSTSGNVVLVFTVVNMNINLVAQKHLVSSTGTIIASGTASASTATSASPLTFTNLDDPTTTSTNCSDRIMLRLTFSTANTMTQTATFGVDRTGTYAISSINHNSLGCSVLRKSQRVVSYK